MTVTKTASVPDITHLQATPPALAEVDGLDRHGYLFGQKLTASLSPLLHDVVYQNLGLNWAQVRLDSTDMDLFLKLRQHPKFYGQQAHPPPLTEETSLPDPILTTTHPHPQAHQ